MIAPFPYFGGKRTVADDIWRRLGAPSQYIEPFCGSAAVLLACPAPASLEVVCDGSGFIANFWRAVKYQPGKVAEWADYPVSHIDLGARHRWLMGQRGAVGESLQDPDWPGDAKVAGWWLWGQCCWIGSGWCDWARDAGPEGMGKKPNVNAGFGGGVGINGAGSARRQRGHGHPGGGEGLDATSAGMGIQAVGQVPQYNETGRGINGIGKTVTLNAPEGLLTSAGRAAWVWLHKLADRLERVRVVHGDWTRCLNNHFGGSDTAVFLDPPYRAYEKLYGVATPVANAVAAWALANQHLRIALCGHRGDYDLPGWDAVGWSRGRLTYGGGKTTAEECVWYSPACLSRRQVDLFADVVTA